MKTRKDGNDDNVDEDNAEEGSDCAYNHATRSRWREWGVREIEFREKEKQRGKDDNDDDEDDTMRDDEGGEEERRDGDVVVSCQQLWAMTTTTTICTRLTNARTASIRGRWVRGEHRLRH